MRGLEAMTTELRDSPAGSQQLATGALFDHLIGDCEEVRRDSEAQSVGSSPIDDELNLGGLGNRQIPRRFSVEKARRAYSHATISIGQIASVAHQPRQPV